MLPGVDRSSNLILLFMCFSVILCVIAPQTMNAKLAANNTNQTFIAVIF